MQNRWTYVALAANILVWGYNWVPLHLLVQQVPPAMLVAARVVLGALTLFVAVVVLRKPLRLPRSPMFAVVGLLQVAGMMGLSTFALLYGDVSRTTILVFTMPFWATIFSSLILKERITPRRWAAIGIALFGLGFIGLHASGQSGALLGAAFAVAAGACWALGSVLAKRHLSGEDLLNGVFWQQVAGAVPLIVFAIFAHETLAAPSFTTIGLFVFASVVGTGLGWVLWANVLKGVTASTASLGSLGIPLVAAFAALAQLGERPDSVSMIGLGAIVLALVLSSLPAAPEVKRRVPRDYAVPS
ncbi:MAG: DMT family transporter [Candidatus Eremiobacteraeota bacterium]|nr:DMT family transporter [Candidatus Eremiobacteraeota bacterium]